MFNSPLSKFTLNDALVNNLLHTVKDRRILQEILTTIDKFDADTKSHASRHFITLGKYLTIVGGNTSVIAAELNRRHYCQHLNDDPYRQSKLAVATAVVAGVTGACTAAAVLASATVCLHASKAPNAYIGNLIASAQQEAGAQKSNAVFLLPNFASRFYCSSNSMQTKTKIAFQRKIAAMKEAEIEKIRTATRYKLNELQESFNRVQQYHNAIVAEPNLRERLALSLAPA